MSCICCNIPTFPLYVLHSSCSFTFYNSRFSEISFWWGTFFSDNLFVFFFYAGLSCWCDIAWFITLKLDLRFLHVSKEKRRRCGISPVNIDLRQWKYVISIIKSRNNFKTVLNIEGSEFKYWKEVSLNKEPISFLFLL